MAAPILAEQRRRAHSSSATAVLPAPPGGADGGDAPAKLAWSNDTAFPDAPAAAKPRGPKSVALACCRRCVARPAYGTTSAMIFDMACLVVLALVVFETAETGTSAQLHEFLAGPGRGQWTEDVPLEHKRAVLDWLFDAYIPEALKISSPYNGEYPPHPRMQIYIDFPVYFPQGMANVFQVRRRLPMACSSERMRVNGKGVDEWRKSQPQSDPYPPSDNPGLDPDRMRHMYFMMGLNCSATEVAKRPFGTWITDDGQVQKDTCPFSDFTEYMEYPMPTASSACTTEDDEAGLSADSNGEMTNCTRGAYDEGMCDHETETTRVWFRSKCCQSCNAASDKTSGGGACSADDTAQLTTDTSGQMTTCDYGVGEGYCSKDPDWAATANWFATVCCKSCAGNSKKRHLKSTRPAFGTASAAPTTAQAPPTTAQAPRPTTVKIPAGMPQRPFQSIELLETKMLNNMADRYRQMVIPGAVSKYKNTTDLQGEQPTGDPLNVVFFRVQMGSGTAGWKEALLKCGWIDPLTELIVVRAPVLIPSAMSFGDIVHYIRFTPFGKVKSIKQRIVLTSLNEYLVNSGASSSEGWKNAHESPGLALRYVIILGYMIIITLKLYWAISGLLVDVHRHCCFCQRGCCAKLREALHSASGETQPARRQRQRSAAQGLRLANEVAENGSCRWVLWRMKKAMSLTLLLDVVFLASFVAWWVTTLIQQLASMACVNFIAEMGRKTELAGGGLGMDGINVWMAGWASGTEELLVSGCCSSCTLYSLPDCHPSPPTALLCFIVSVCGSDPGDLLFCFFSVYVSPPPFVLLMM